MLARRSLALAVLGAAVLCGAAYVVRGRRSTEQPEESRTGNEQGSSVPSTLAGSRRVHGHGETESGRRADLLVHAAVAAEPELARAALLELDGELSTQSWTLGDLWRLATLSNDSLFAEQVRKRAAERLLAEEYKQALPALLLAAGRSSDERERSLAAKILEEHPLVDETLVPEFRRFLADESADYSCKMALLRSIEGLGARAAALAPDLVAWIRGEEERKEELQRKNPGTLYNWGAGTYHIASAISTMGAAALPVLLRALDELEIAGASRWFVRPELEYAIAKMPAEAGPALLALVADPREGVRAAALEALLGHEDPSAAVLSAARDALRDSSAAVREKALVGLARRNSTGADEMVRALSDPSSEVRSAVSEMLSTRPDVIRAVMPRVLEMLHGSDYADQLAAAGLLPHLGNAGLEAVPDLVRMRAHVLNDSLYRDSGPALEALLALGSAAAPRIVEVAANSTGDVRSAALDVLRRLDGVGGSQLSPLAGDLDRLKGVPQMEAAGALARGGDVRAQTVLLEGLSSEEVGVRVAAARGLAASSTASPAAVDLLAALERDAAGRLHAPGAQWSKEWRPYYAYHVALVRTGRAIPAAVIPLLSDPSGDVRKTAADALVEAGAEGTAQVSAAWSALDSDAKRTVLMPSLLGEHGKEPAAGVRELGLRALEDEDPAVRLRAAEVFGRLPDLQAAAIGAQIELLTSPRSEIARQAASQLSSSVRELGPYEARLREVRGITDAQAARQVQDLLDVLAAAQRAGR